MFRKMGVRVVGIVASPRKNMNTDVLVTEVLEGAGSVGAETEKIYLNDLQIKPCQACSESPAPKYCRYEDGMDRVYEVIESAGVLVIGTPAYYGSVSAQLKLVIDRSNCLTELVRLPGGGVAFQTRIRKRRRGVFIWVADSSRDPEHALAMVRLWCRDANIELVDTLAVTDSDGEGGARSRKDLLSRAFRMGVSLGQGF